MHPSLTRRVRVVMAYNNFIYRHRGLKKFGLKGWKLTHRYPGCVFKKDVR